MRVMFPTKVLKWGFGCNKVNLLQGTGEHGEAVQKWGTGGCIL
jgi:hypothetical protein